MSDLMYGNFMGKKEKKIICKGYIWKSINHRKLVLLYFMC